ncbi:MAG: RNA polymerase subunit sigma-24, partial [Ardenticatenia bacterium]|nr:RNA polymerase subunit sigma-24 [Ardenticatenia bacterium]
MEEQEAIARLKRGDISGLEALVRQYQVRAVRTAYLIIR